jgi:hypothetical protein
VRELFSFVGPDHPFAPHLERLRVGVDAHPLCGETLRHAATTEVRALMRGQPVPGGGWQLKRVDLSFQSRVDANPLRFHAVTLLYSGRTAWTEAFEFPNDPSLTPASFFASAATRGSEIDVLRYVPRRRLTFRVHRPSDEEAPTVGKFLRHAELEPAYATLAKVRRAVTAAGTTFSVAAPMGIERDLGVFFQQVRPGTPLAALLDADRCGDLLRRVGVIHREIHTLAVADVPTWDVRAFLDEVTNHVTWVSFFQPRHASCLEALRDLLVAHVPPVDPRTYTFCHGDFRCAQVLREDGRWSVVDFDGAMRADPHLELAHMMAFLKYDVPRFRDLFADPEQDATDLVEAAARAYLAGYEERAKEPVNPKRLLWYRIGSEIHYLDRMISRDLFNPVAFDRTLKLLGDLGHQLLVLGASHDRRRRREDRVPLS